MNKGDRHDTVRAVRWEQGSVVILDQRRLPGSKEYLRLASAAAVRDAISEMAVRGAPAIGVAAAYGAVLAAREAYREHGGDWRGRCELLLDELAAARPTAVNLRWAVERQRSLLDGIQGDPEPALLAEAQRIHEADIAGNRRMGELGAALVEGAVLTHCNAGSLATGGYGTALGIVRSAFRAGRLTHVFACETRPWLQGARLTAWELLEDGIPVTVIADSAAASLMQAGSLQAVVVGADRIAANGDVINKIGTYALAVLARHHGLPFIVAAPLSTIDLGTATGREVPIEQRRRAEISRLGEHEITPAGAAIANPVFDITPAALVSVLVTEKGLVEAPDGARIRALFEG